MLKKAQITLILLIFGVIFVAVVSINLLVQKDDTIPLPNADIQPVKSFIESCLQSQAESGLLFLGLQGGIYEPKPSFQYLTMSIPYYLQINDTSMPSLERIEDELDLFIQDNLEYCINDFEGLSATGFSVAVEDLPKAKAAIEADDVLITLDYPIKVTQGETTYEIRDYQAEVPFDFKDIYDEIVKVMQQQEKDPLAMHLGFLAKSAYDSNYFFEVIQMNENTVIYSFKFDSKLKNEPYLFNFAVRYDW